MLIVVALCLAACATKPPQNPVVTPTPDTQSQQQTPAVNTQNPAQNATPMSDGQQGQEFVATQELYKKTFDEVQATIDTLTKLISAGDYDSWLQYLTADYVQETGSAKSLSDASNSGVLKKNGIVLKNLKDYFNNVVVRSHLQATLSEIQFVDATHVKALTQIQGTSVILYYLVHEGGRWKVGLRPTGTD